MGQITSLFAWKVIGEVDATADQDALLRSVGVDPDAPIDPKRMVSDDDYYAFFERCAQADPKGATLSLRVGAAMRCDEYGAFGLAWKSAPNLRGSYARAERYARVLTSVSTYEVERTDDGALMHLHRAGERQGGLRLSNEASIAAVVAISQEASAVTFQPLAVYFKHSAPNFAKSAAGHEAHFGCPVHFDTDRDAILVSNEALQAPNKVGDESISRFFDTHLDADLAQLDDSLARRVQIRISRSLSEGMPTISDVAEYFGMSGRTLQRRLSEHGDTFQSLVDEARRQLATRLLEETDYSLAEVAFMTGFAEQSSFTRAFKRWAGQTPRSYRLSSS